MPELITEMVGGESYQYCPLGNYVLRAVGVCGGRPTLCALSYPMPESATSHPR